MELEASAQWCWQGLKLWLILNVLEPDTRHRRRHLAQGIVLQMLLMLDSHCLKLRKFGALHS